MTYISSFGFSLEDIQDCSRRLDIGYAAADLYLQDQFLKEERAKREEEEYYA